MQEDALLDQRLAREADAQAHSYAMQDFVEGLAAIKEKRPPKFV